MIEKKPRVFLVGASNRPDSMEAHVIETLQFMGCELSVIDIRTLLPGLSYADRVLRKVAEVSLRQPERLFEARLLRQAAGFNPDLVLVLASKMLSPWTVDKLKQRLGVPVVCWFQDSIAMLARQYMIGAAYDAVFVKDRYLVELLTRMLNSTKVHYLPEACNPRVHRPLAPTPAERERYACDIMLAGTLYYYRQEILRHLDTFDLKLWGNWTGMEWFKLKLNHRPMGREVLGDEKAKAVAASRLVLNPLHYAEINSLNCRAFEMAACGACQLISDKPVLAEHFEPGIELVKFDSATDLVDKVRYYLDRPEEADRIRTAASARAHSDHTYEKRLSEIFRISLGDPAPAAV